MKRITKIQKAVFDNHVKAWEEGRFDFDSWHSSKVIIRNLKGGKTYRPLWNYVFGSMSTTSQLIADEKVFNHLTATGKADMRNTMKRVLTKMGIR